MRFVFSFATKCPLQPLITISVKKGFLCEKWNSVQLKFDQIVWLEKRFHLQKFSSSLSRFVGTIGIIVGAVFGSVAALAITGILVWWTCRKKRRNTKGTEGKCYIHIMLSNEKFWNPRNISVIFFLFLRLGTGFSSLSTAWWSLLKHL